MISKMKFDIDAKRISSENELRRVFMFQISSIVATTHDSSFGGFKWKVIVLISIPVKEWSKMRDKGWLGQLYGIDVSNAVYAVNRNIPAMNPTVDHSRRSAKGRKSISLTYFLNDPDKAQSLGLTVNRTRSGEVYSAFSEHIQILTKEAIIRQMKERATISMAEYKQAKARA
jgi:hypothetical protein